MTVEEILREAIRGEEESYKLYTDAVDLVRAEHIKGLLRELAQEELGHKTSLEGMLADPEQLQWQVGALQAAPIEDYQIADSLRHQVEPAGRLIAGQHLLHTLQVLDDRGDTRSIGRPAEPDPGAAGEVAVMLHVIVPLR